MKKLLIVFCLLSISLFGSVFANYTASEIALGNKIADIVETKIEKKGEALRKTFISILKSIKAKDSTDEKLFNLLSIVVDRLEKNKKEMSKIIKTTKEGNHKYLYIYAPTKDTVYDCGDNKQCVSVYKMSCDVNLGAFDTVVWDVRGHDGKHIYTLDLSRSKTAMNKFADPFDAKAYNDFYYDLGDKYTNCKIRDSSNRDDRVFESFNFNFNDHLENINGINIYSIAPSKNLNIGYYEYSFTPENLVGGYKRESNSPLLQRLQYEYKHKINKSILSFYIKKFDTVESTKKHFDGLKDLHYEGDEKILFRTNNDLGDELYCDFVESKRLRCAFRYDDIIVDINGFFYNEEVNENNLNKLFDNITDAFLKPIMKNIEDL